MFSACCVRQVSQPSNSLRVVLVLPVAAPRPPGLNPASPRQGLGHGLRLCIRLQRPVATAHCVGAFPACHEIVPVSCRSTNRRIDLYICSLRGAACVSHVAGSIKPFLPPSLIKTVRLPRNPMGRRLGKGRPSIPSPEVRERTPDSSMHVSRSHGDAVYLVSI